MKQTNCKHTRREFFRGAVRGAALTAMAGGAAVLAVRAVRLGDCTGRGRCSGCGSLPQCELPQALVTRGGGREQ